MITEKEKGLTAIIQIEERERNVLHGDSAESEGKELENCKRRIACQICLLPTNFRTLPSLHDGNMPI